MTDPIFHNEAKALAHIEAQRWPDGEPICPHCGSTHITKMGGKTQAGMFLCNDCRDKFTVRTGTVMERSHIPLHKWLLATHLMAASKKGMSALQMSRMLGITYKSAWFLCHRIREAMDKANDTGPLGGPGKVIESDEAFVGGFKKKRLSGNVAPKKKIVTLVERGGPARSFHITNIDHTTIRAALVTNCHRSSVLMTDDARFYNNIGREFAAHGTTLHSNREFSRGDGHHSNTAENFFSILKRGVIGTYHHWSAAHTHRYLAEFDLRYSTKDKSDTDRANDILKGMEGRRLTYRRIGLLAA
ncbi:IS1595 family transposase [Sphingomonas sp. G124]|uniref:IS1595 family transposase n=1 Tax=Sphingomonas cremea TaxID=2904799 RepID=A0A9X1QJ38_9SPHN|nr:IS1595 family transposase [Sphingomonas cremea]MCF2513666.1 IS1595 family transposase [Sphingomonas cremea]